MWLWIPDSKFSFTRLNQKEERTEILIGKSILRLCLGTVFFNINLDKLYQKGLSK